MLKGAITLVVRYALYALHSVLVAAGAVTMTNRITSACQCRQSPTGSEPGCLC